MQLPTPPQRTPVRQTEEDREGWAIRELPAAPLSHSVRLLLAEARQEGFDWMANLEAAWLERPFVGPGEGLFLAWMGDRLVAGGDDIEHEAIAMGASDFVICVAVVVDPHAETDEAV